MPGTLSNRIAYQVKAMLENAELSISEAKQLTACALLARADPHTETLADTIGNLKRRWTEPGTLPRNIQGLARNLIDLSRTLRIQLPEVWAILDRATTAGRGASLLNLSPYAAVLDALVTERKDALFGPLDHPNNTRCLFVPAEIELPLLPSRAQTRIIRPTA